MGRLKKSIGIICISILAGLLITCMYFFKAALVGISIGIVLVALIIGAVWGLSK